MLLDSIRTQLDSLSKSERKVALAVLDHPGQTVSQNITALAKSAQVSEPTVVRFCRTLGYDGWHEFKLKLAQGLALALPGLIDDQALAARCCALGVTVIPMSVYCVGARRGGLVLSYVGAGLDRIGPLVQRLAPVLRRALGGVPTRPASRPISSALTRG